MPDANAAPPQRGRGCFLIFLVPFVLAALMLGYFKHSDLAGARGLALYQPRATLQGPDGPLLLRGELVSLGAPAMAGAPIAWMSARLEPRPAHGSAPASTCREQHLEPIALRLSNGEQVSLEGLLAPDHLDWSDIAGSPSDTRFRIKAGSPHEKTMLGPSAASHLTSPLVRNLPLPCPPTPDQETPYRYQVLRQGDAVKIVACLRGGQLVPCDDAATRLACEREPGSGPCEHNPGAMLSGPVSGQLSSRLPIGFFELWTGMILLLAYLLFASMLPTLPGDES